MGPKLFYGKRSQYVAELPVQEDDNLDVEGDSADDDPCSSDDEDISQYQSLPTPKAGHKKPRLTLVPKEEQLRIDEQIVPFKGKISKTVQPQKVPQMGKQGKKHWPLKDCKASTAQELCKEGKTTAQKRGRPSIELQQQIAKKAHRGRAATLSTSDVRYAEELEVRIESLLLVTHITNGKNLPNATQYLSEFLAKLHLNESNQSTNNYLNVEGVTKYPIRHQLHTLAYCSNQTLSLTEDRGVTKILSRRWEYDWNTLFPLEDSENEQEIPFAGEELVRGALELRPKNDGPKTTEILSSSAK
ncbi:hypothetical protein ILUMI_04413 [Ignelater luminosus]|uniref:Uncharacterized protein n=1 Tax=Ignelater luminosus TaxID=2038154 RepID=A0A8K0GJ25_IGNLU|nr:hypothetical protein ILUMI_04413 [Ignelater luminosus]